MQLKKPLLAVALTVVSLSALAQTSPPHEGPPDGPPGLVHDHAPPPEAMRHAPPPDGPPQGPPPDGFHGHMPPPAGGFREHMPPPPDNLHEVFAVREFEKRLHRQRGLIMHMHDEGLLAPVEFAQFVAKDDQIEHRMREMQEHHEGLLTVEDQRELNRELNRVRDALRHK